MLKEPDRDPTSQSWMWVQVSGPPDRKVVLFDYTSSRAQDAVSLAGQLSRLRDDR
ncbi:IS66 family transposase [Pseudomonas brassicacearum]|uniref:IS66 family transposase n=1 Tax=Pseudomonas brassicacearum TaxID=930166 RepID=UPI001866C622|nr:transposase [Pseudomonas brassicacearum]